MTTKKLEPKQLLDRMRNEAAELLKYDLNNLTAAQSVRLDRAAALRLELDDVQSRQLAGLPIDMAKFVVASEALERLVGGNPETSTTGHDFSGAREELRQFFARRAEAIARRDARAAEAQRGVPKFGETFSDPGGGDDAERDRSVSLPEPSSPLAAAGSEHPVLIEPPEICATAAQIPPPAQQQPRRKSLEEINTPTNPAPGPREAWRDYVNSDEIISPWFVPHG